MRSGIGVAVTVQVADTYQDLCFRPLEPALVNGCVLVWKKNQTLPAALEKFIGYVELWLGTN